jgi:hypothetical protein
MTTPSQAFNRPPTFAETLQAEEAQVKAGVNGCGHTCPGCHGNLTCIRVAHTDEQPHAGRDTDGNFVQWIGPCNDNAARAAYEFLDGAAR